MIGILSLVPFSKLNPFSAKPKPKENAPKVVLPQPQGSGPISVEPESFAGQLGKGVGQGLKILLILGAVGAVVVFFGPQLAAMFFKNSVSAVASARGA